MAIGSRPLYAWHYYVYYVCLFWANKVAWLLAYFLIFVFSFPDLCLQLYTREHCSEIRMRCSCSYGRNTTTTIQVEYSAVLQRVRITVDLYHSWSLRRIVTYSWLVGRDFKNAFTYPKWLFDPTLNWVAWLDILRRRWPVCLQELYGVILRWNYVQSVWYITVLGKFEFIINF